jgi:hypothetical protein
VGREHSDRAAIPLHFAAGDDGRLPPDPAGDRPHDRQPGEHHDLAFGIEIETVDAVRVFGEERRQGRPPSWRHFDQADDVRIAPEQGLYGAIVTGCPCPQIG